MKDVARQLRFLIEKSEILLSRIRDGDLVAKADPNQWSKKEILGHLIDSAANNHQRFVRAVGGVANQFPPYDQEHWVRTQRYNERPWASLVALWSAYNSHLAHVIESIPEDARSSPCNIGKEEPVSLDFVVKDYLHHLQLHLKDILDQPG